MAIDSPTSTSPPRVDRRTLAEQVYERVLSMLLAGDLQPGERLRESDLAARLGVSRTPIREALGRLAEYGVVETRPNHGAVVRRLGREELSHIHEVREALEGQAAERACGRLTDADFAHLDALAERARDEAAPDYLEAFNEFDVVLHRLIATRSGNPIIAREIAKLHDMTMLIHEQMERVLLGGEGRGDVDRRAVRRLAWKQHCALIAALRSGDPAASRQAMVEHVRAQCAFKIRLMPGLAQAGGTGSALAAAAQPRHTPPATSSSGHHFPGP